MQRETGSREGDRRVAKQEVFVVGRICGGEQKYVFRDPAARPVFPGPWQVRAILVD